MQPDDAAPPGTAHRTTAVLCALLTVLMTAGLVVITTDLVHLYTVTDSGSAPGTLRAIARNRWIWLALTAAGAVGFGWLTRYHARRA